MAKRQEVAEKNKARTHDEPSSFVRFVRSTVGPLSRAFAESPLAQLRVRTPEGAVTLTKAPPVHEAEAPHAEAGDSRLGHARATQAPRIYQGEAGRAYDTINAEVVGLFRDIAEPPATGDRLEAGRVLGHIEALRLRNEVRCPVDCTLIAQVVVDGQPVDFGEPLFVVDSGSATTPGVEQVERPEAVAELAEPPRI